MCAANDSDIGFPGSCTIAKFDPGNCEHCGTNFLFDDGFAHVGDTQASHHELLRSGGDLAHNRHDIGSNSRGGPGKRNKWGDGIFGLIFAEM